MLILILFTNKHYIMLLYFYHIIDIMIITITIVIIITEDSKNHIQLNLLRYNNKYPKNIHYNKMYY
jgi:hypothetical protein